MGRGVERAGQGCCSRAAGNLGNSMGICGTSLIETAGKSQKIWWMQPSPDPTCTKPIP